MDKMKKKQQFIKPEILRELRLLGDGPILAGSIVDSNFVLETNGQVVDNVDAGGQDWNQKWTWED